MHPPTLVLAALLLLDPEDAASETGSPPPQVTPAVPAGPQRSPLPEVAVQIDTSALDQADGRAMEFAIRGRTELVLAARGYFLDDAAKDSILVRIDVMEGSDLGCLVLVQAYDDGRLVDPGEARIAAASCSPATVASAYADRLPVVLDALAAANAAAVVLEPPGVILAPVDPVPEPSPPPVVVPSPRPARSPALRRAGLATLVPGVVALGAGIGMMLAGSQPVDRGDEAWIVERHFRPPGIAASAIGGVAALLGIALLSSDARRGARRQRTRARLTWRPEPGSPLGVGLESRF